MPKVYDDALKKLFRANAQDFVSLIQDGLSVEELLPTELDAEHIYADGLVRCRDENGEAQLAHFEYQREKDERMGERLIEYNLKASRMNGYVPVLSCVIALKKEKDAPRSPFVKKLLNGIITTTFHYASIDLGELTVEEFLEKVKGKASLLPLTAGGNEPAAIDIMITELIAAEKTDLLWIGYILAAKVFDHDDLQWLKRRFALMNDFLWDSPVYQEIITQAESKGFAEGKEEGKVEGVETEKMRSLSQVSQIFLKLVNDRFPALGILAQTCAVKIGDNSALFQLGWKVSSAQTEQEAEKILKLILKP